MGKAIKISIGVILLLLIVSPYFAGKMVETDYNNLIAKLKARAGSSGMIEGKFERGIFTSKATTTISNGSAGVVLEHAIKHGPLIFANDEGKFRLYPKIGKAAQVNTKLTAEQQKVVEAVYGNKPAYKVVTYVAFNGDVETNFTNLPFNMSTPEGSLNWQGFNGKLSLNKDLTKYNFSIKFPLADYTENGDVKIEANITNLKFEAYKSDKDVNDKVNVSVDSFKLVSPADQTNLSNFVFKVSHKTTQKVVDGEISINFDKLVITEQEYGPLVFDVQLKNCDASAFGILMGNPDLTDQQATKLLLTQKMQVNMHSSFVTPQGKVSGELQGEIGGPGMDPSNHKQVMASMTSTGNIKISEKLLAQFLVNFADAQIKRQERLYYMQHETSQVLNPYSMTDQQKKSIISIWIRKTLEYLSAQKYLILQDGIYSSKIDINKGVLSVNGVVKTDADIQKLKELQDIVPEDHTIVPVAPVTKTPGVPASPPSPATAPTAPAVATPPVVTTPTMPVVTTPPKTSIE